MKPHQLLDSSDRPFRPLDHILGILEKDPPGFGGFNAPPRPVKERRTDFRFEFLDYRRQRRLRNSQPARSARHVPCPRDLSEVSKGRQLHGSSLRKPGPICFQLP